VARGASRALYRVREGGSSPLLIWKKLELGLCGLRALAQGRGLRGLRTSEACSAINRVRIKIKECVVYVDFINWDENAFPKDDLKVNYRFGRPFAWACQEDVFGLPGPGEVIGGVDEVLPRGIRTC
jgi:hypothetical protein